MVYYSVMDERLMKYYEVQDSKRVPDVVHLWCNHCGRGWSRMKDRTDAHSDILPLLNHAAYCQGAKPWKTSSSR